MRLLIYLLAVLILLVQTLEASPAGQHASSTKTAALSSKLSKCARDCWVPLVAETKCGLADVECLCKDDDFQKVAADCFKTSCSAEERLAASRIQKSTCGVPARDRTETTRITTWTLFGFTVLAVALRFLARAPLLGGTGYGWDDWTILACLAVLIPMDVLLNIMLDLGLGKDMWMLEPFQITGVLFWFWVEEYVYTVVVLLTKISILLLYIRLFPETERWFRPACLLLMAACVVTVIPVYISIVFQCKPISYAWHKWDATHSGTCINTVAQISSLAAVNIILDLVIILLPVPRLLKLNISAGKKIGVVAVFTIGLFVTVTSAVRLQYVVHWGTSPNPTWQYNPLALWSAIECSFTVICACLPPLAGPMKRLFKGTLANRFFSSSDSEMPISRKPSLLFFRDIKRCFKNETTTPKLPTFVTIHRALDSTDELELVDTNQRQQIEEAHGT